MTYEEMMKEKAQETWGCAKLTVEQCRTCAFSKGPAPWADRPEKAYCIKYPRDGSNGSKPDSVLFEGEPCEFYATEAQLKAALEALEEERRKFYEQRARERQGR